MIRLYDGFDLGSPDFSASMTISGPAPIIMAMYIAARSVASARHRAEAPRHHPG
jgi:methylmalonyl-CoA mutase N-terminal domain/subunit